MNFVSACLCLFSKTDQSSESSYAMPWCDIAVLVASAAYMVWRNTVPIEDDSFKILRSRENFHRNMLMDLEILDRRDIFEEFCQQEHCLACEYKEARKRNSLIRKEILDRSSISKALDPNWENCQARPSRMGSKCRQWQEKLPPLQTPTKELLF